VIFPEGSGFLLQSKSPAILEGERRAMLMEIMKFIVSVLTLFVNTGRLVICYCQYKKRAATTSDSDGSATGK
jgi:hypothetical protein